MYNYVIVYNPYDSFELDIIKFESNHKDLLEVFKEYEPQWDEVKDMYDVFAENDKLILDRGDLAYHVKRI